MGVHVGGVFGGESEVRGRECGCTCGGCIWGRRSEVRGRECGGCIWGRK